MTARAEGPPPSITAIPPESAMAHADAAQQRLLLNSLQAGAIIDPKGCWQLNAPLSRPATVAMDAQLGRFATQLSGIAQVEQAKGNFALASDNVLGARLHTLGIWIYLAADSNVSKIGFELEDDEREALTAFVPADWTGWKWLEADLGSGAFVEDSPQPGKNHKIDFPLHGVRIAWRAKHAGPTNIMVNDLCATADPSTAAAPIQPAIVGPTYTEPGTPLNTLLSITNSTDATSSASIEFSVQHDSSMFDATPPDPIFGPDRALGAKSWTQADGDVIEQGSLTDGKKWTYAETPQIGNHWTEAFQFIDLGQERRITRMGRDSGDAGKLIKVDISTSLDGREYAPISSLQDFDLFKKWGSRTFPMAEPVNARFIRFRYHKGGAKLSGIRMPEEISVFDHPDDPAPALPSVGRVIASGTFSAEVPARAFVVLPITSDAKLTPGAYLVAVKATFGGKPCFTWNHLMVMPEPIQISENSRFGINGATPQIAGDLERLGVGWLRFENLKGPFVSAEPGKYDFHGTSEPHVDIDGIMEAYHSHHLNILPFLFLFPKYLLPTATPPGSVLPSDLSSFGDFVFQTVARYGSTRHPPEEMKSDDKKSGLGLINVFEIWNEENQGSFGKWNGPARYYDMFRLAAEAVKKADPTAKVSNGGFSGIGLQLADELKTYKYPDGQSPLDFLDVLNVHYYTGQSPPETCHLNANTGLFGSVDPRSFEENLALLREWRDRNKPGLPIWLTETGYETDYTYFVDDRTQAAFLARDVLLCLANGMDKVMVFRETGSDAFRWGAAGVMRTDSTPKPSLFTYATLIRQMEGVTGAGLRLPTNDDNIRVYAWNRDGKTLLTAWCVEGTAKLPLKLGEVTVTDAFGDRQEAVDGNSLALTSFPIYISDIASSEEVNSALTRGKSEQARHAELVAQEIAQKAYLYGFGSADDVGGTIIGDFRWYTPVLSADIYNPARGFGFYPKPALADQGIHRPDSQNQHACKMGTGIQFRFQVDPGNYLLDVGAAPSRASVNVLVSGAMARPQTFQVLNKTGDGRVPIQVNSPGQLSIEFDGTALLRWVTLVEATSNSQASPP